MQVVPRPLHHPGQCIVTLTSEDPLGFIDTTLNLSSEIDPMIFSDPHIYVSMSWVKEMAIKQFDMVGREVVEELERKVARLEDQVREADEFAEAAEYTLHHFGERVKRKPGPRKEKVKD